MARISSRLRLICSSLAHPRQALEYVRPCLWQESQVLLHTEPHGLGDIAHGLWGELRTGRRGVVPAIAIPVKRRATHLRSHTAWSEALAHMPPGVVQPPIGRLQDGAALRGSEHAACPLPPYLPREKCRRHDARNDGSFQGSRCLSVHSEEKSIIVYLLLLQLFRVATTVTTVLARLFPSRQCTSNAHSQQAESRAHAAAHLPGDRDNDWHAAHWGPQ